jgi:ubiquinol-cytochrome c reductase iron-sulfur subunit
MPLARHASYRPAINRRGFLYATTAVAGAAGAVAAAWPFIDQMNPDARARAAGDIIDVDLTDLHPAEQRMVHWRHYSVFVVRRTPAMLDAMQDEKFVARLIDPNSQTRQQPSYAKNWHRSVDPAFAVLVGLCTHEGCVATYSADASVLDLAGGYFCPCCNAHYDPAGRVFSGTPAQYNLPVPPYEISRRSRISISIGKNPSGELFSFESIETI